MPDLSNFKISFLYHGHISFVHVVASTLHEADVWKHLADRLGVFYCDPEGYAMLSHAIKKLVEANGVTDIMVEKSEISGVTSQPVLLLLQPLQQQTGSVVIP